jgi:hypothetical protein
VLASEEGGREAMKPKSVEVKVTISTQAGRAVTALG